MTHEPASRRSGRHRSRGRVSVPARVAPGSTGPRLPGLDVARGVALVLMVLGLTAPPGEATTAVRHLAAPLVVLCLGAAAGLTLERHGMRAARFAADTAVRGVLLLVLGVLLGALTDRLEDLLPVLGLLVLVLAPLTVLLRHLQVLTVGLATAAAVLAPLAVDRAREHLLAHPGTGRVARDLLGWLAAGEPHRVVSLLPAALAGLVLALLVPHLGAWRRALAVSAILVATSAADLVLAGGATEGGQADTSAELAAGAFLAAGVVAAACALTGLLEGRRAGPALLSPLLAGGRLPLTGYTLLALTLAVDGAARGDGATRGWGLAAVALVVVLGGCWLLDHAWGTGPLEVVLRLARLPAGRRPPSPRRAALSGERPRPEPPAHRRSTPPAA
ncbi:hypothetical protein H9L10_02075 [Phycicoccus endophyticus]|uniref:DUF418 domain-containing protein n=1 Tax=Phycicoccus endophyticus TaxID=1690220 RepID=A0A7G9R2S4_9MICO|nr:hypothetical protein [Phycicoccus endophyticus]NHI20366.1 hypothetical protein [Phycicoccus endophyticus]QNN49899.1 hypothetical protein H9L10_02075 [Phycicoccus endophyticus]